jgi:hypothetical protein
MKYLPLLISLIRYVALFSVPFIVANPAAARDSVAHAWLKPMDLPILLSGSFSELRSNHFHSGIDFKTAGRVGKEVVTVHDGYISRISVSPSGYGNAIYVDHPNGLTTVYAHLLRFNDSIAAYVQAEQYRVEQFKVDIAPEPSRFPLEQGALLGWSGNSGSSGGPHLHFEVRHTANQEVIDPLPFYKDRIKDTRPPKIRSIKVYPIPGKGTLNGDEKPIILTPQQAKDGSLVIDKPLRAWGEIAFAINAYDYMDNTSNTYGIQEILLTADSALLFRNTISPFLFDETRYLNTLIDFAEWSNSRAFFIKSHVEPANRLRGIETPHRGTLIVDTLKAYQLNYLLTDSYGNSTALHFKVTGVEQPIQPIDLEHTTLFTHRTTNRWGAKGIRLSIPQKCLYSNVHFHYSVKADSSALASTHYLHHEPLPLHQAAQLSLHLQHDTLANKAQYGIVKLSRGRQYWIGGTYRNKWIDADVRELGVYTIARDNIAPRITPLNKDKWRSSRKISFKITDNLSGVKAYRAEIDNQFVLFAHDAKTATITYHLTKQQALREHSVKLIVTDGCGNNAVYTNAKTKQ